MHVTTYNGNEHTQYVAPSDLQTVNTGTSTSAQLTRFLLPPLSTPISACYIVANHSTIWSNIGTDTHVDGDYMTNQTDTGAAISGSHPTGMDDPVCLNSPATSNSTDCYVKPKDISREGVYYFKISAWSYGTPFGKQKISDRYQLIVGCSWDTDHPMEMTNDASFINSFAITVGDPNLDNLYTYHLPYVTDVSRRSYCAHLSHEITNI